MKRTPWLVAVLAVIVGGSCQQQDRDVTVEIRVAEEQPGEDLTEMVISGWGHADTFYVHDDVLLTNSEIDSASVVRWRDHPAIEVLLSEAGRQRFAEVTAQNIGNRLGMLVDGRLVCAPVVRDTIPGGKAIINGDFTEDEARRIAEGLLRR